jgi:hypothetical protein
MRGDDARNSVLDSGKETAMQLLQRVTAIILRPESEWPVIAGEPGEAKTIFIHYVAILALIPAICGFLGGLIIGTPPVAGALDAILGYVSTFVLVYAGAWIVNGLATLFKGERNFPNALKLTVYSLTPLWLAGVFTLVPALRFLIMLGLYGLYLLWTGLPPLMRIPENKAFPYAVLAVVCAIAIKIVFAIVQGSTLSLVRLG